MCMQAQAFNRLPTLLPPPLTHPRVPSSPSCIAQAKLCDRFQSDVQSLLVQKQGPYTALLEAYGLQPDQLESLVQGGGSGRAYLELSGASFLPGGDTQVGVRGAGIGWHCFLSCCAPLSRRTTKQVSRLVFESGLCGCVESAAPAPALIRCQDWSPMPCHTGGPRHLQQRGSHHLALHRSGERQGRPADCVRRRHGRGTGAVHHGTAGSDQSHQGPDPGRPTAMLLRITAAALPGGTAAFVPWVEYAWEVPAAELADMAAVAKKLMGGK